MRNFKAYMTLLAVGALSLTACQDDFDTPEIPAPVATIEANTTINEVKTRYWNDATNYIDTIRLNDAGEHVVIAGRVISSDAAGNIYKSLVIQDETGALAMSINANSMYNKYRMGQEVVVDLTDMYIGKYNGLQQLGFPEEYQDTYEATFMPYEFFEMHSQLNGNPEPAKIDTLLVNSYSELSTSPEGLRKWQSQLVRFNNCHFEQGGQTTFTDGHKTTSNRTLILADGNSIIVRTSGYSTFWGDVLPAGNGDVVGILSYFGTSGWQLLLNGRNGCMNFGNPTVGPGAEDNPYTVTQAIEVEKAGTSAKGWVTGYIVGAVAPGVQSVTGNDDIEFKADPVMDNTLVIAATPDCKNFEECLVFELPQDSKLRQFGNLPQNPGNYGKQIWISGSLAKFLGTYGITGNRGTASEFRIDGVEIPEDPKPVEGDGTKEKPYTVTQALALGNPGTSAWVTGYIVGWVEGQSIQSGAHFEVPASSASNILIAAEPGVTDYNQCLAVQLVSGTEARDKLNLMNNPGNLGKKISVEGTLEKNFGVAGSKGSTGYEIDGTSGGDTPVTPPAGDAINGTSADLNTMNGGVATSYYSKPDAPLTSTDGWTAINSNLLQGGDTDANPVFKFLGSASTFAVTLNGKAGSAGVLTSPLISGGINTLSFKYAIPYADTKGKLTINIYQNDAVVASDVLENNSMTKFKVYDYSHTFNVSGNFSIEIVNDCPSASTSNKDRVAVWDINWIR